MLETVSNKRFINLLLVIYDILVMCWDRCVAFAHELSVFFEKTTFVERLSKYSGNLLLVWAAAIT